MRAFEAAVSAPWAMLPERLEELLAIAAREHEATPQALEAYRGTQLSRAERATRRGDVAVIEVTGPLFRRANLFTALSGATSYDVLRRDLQAALDDPGVRAIALNVDSPGGEVNGVDELAKAVYAARGAKPITAYVGGMAASGGYWIASAADRIVVSDAALLGSIGVYMAIQDASKRDEARGVHKIEFVSSQSPDKRPDYGSDEGRARIQRTVDQLADVFIQAVARHRGVDPERVVAEFGRGGVEVGQAAVAAGMADAIGTFESVLADLSKRGGSSRATSTVRMIGMTDFNITKAEHEAAVAAAREEGGREKVTAYKARRKEVLALEEAKGREALAETLLETSLSVDEIKASLNAAPKAEQTATAPAATSERPAQALADQRAAAASLAVPGAGSPAPAASGWKKTADRINARA